MHLLFGGDVVGDYNSLLYILPQFVLVNSFALAFGQMISIQAVKTVFRQVKPVAGCG